jgi:tetratricopeptide (TPR) repeat protein
MEVGGENTFCFSYPLSHYMQALTVYQEARNRRGEGIVLGNLADVLLKQGLLEEATTHLQRAIVICDELTPAAAGAFRGVLALMRAQQGDVEEALSLLSVGEPLIESYRGEYGKFLCKRAQVCLIAEDREQAARSLEQAQSIAKTLDAAADGELGLAIQELMTLFSSGEE